MHTFRLDILNILWASVLMIVSSITTPLSDHWQRATIMWASMTDSLENKLIDFLFRGQTYTAQTSWFVGLLTAMPTDSTAGTEVTGGSYARYTIACSMTNFAGTQAAASTIASSGTGGTTSNNIVMTFPAPTANWGTVVGLGLYTLTSGGTLEIFAALTTNRIINNGDPAPKFNAADLTFQIDN